MARGRYVTVAEQAEIIALYRAGAEMRAIAERMDRPVSGIAAIISRARAKGEKIPHHMPARAAAVRKRWAERWAHLPPAEMAFHAVMGKRRHSDARPPSKRHPMRLPYQPRAMQTGGGVSSIYGADARPLDFGAHQ